MLCCLEIVVGGSCCCCIGCVNQICHCIQRICRISISQQIRVAYVMLFFFFSASVLAIDMYLSHWLDKWQILFFIINNPSESSLVIYRISGSLFVLFAILSLACAFKNTISKQFNENFWICKILFLYSMYMCQTLWVDKEVYEYYCYILFATAFSVLFVIFQSLVTIDLAYSLSEQWITAYDQGNSIYAIFLSVSSFVIYTLTIMLVILSSILFSSSTLITSNIILIIILTIANLLPWNRKPSLLVSAFISLLVTYFHLSALVSDPNQLSNENTLLIYQIQLSIDVLLFIVSIAYIAFNRSQRSSSQKEQTIQQAVEKSEFEFDELEPEDEEDFFIPSPSELEEVSPLNKPQKKKSNKSAESPNYAQTIRKELYRINQLRNQRRMYDYYTNMYLYFHLVMLLGSFHLISLITNYGSLSINSKFEWNVQYTSTTAVNIKLTFAYFSAFIYLWTIAAPYIFTNRYF